MVTDEEEASKIDSSDITKLRSHSSRHLRRLGQATVSKHSTGYSQNFLPKIQEGQDKPMPLIVENSAPMSKRMSVKNPVAGPSPMAGSSKGQQDKHVIPQVEIQNSLSPTSRQILP